MLDSKIFWVWKFWRSEKILESNQLLQKWQIHSKKWGHGCSPVGGRPPTEPPSDQVAAEAPDQTLSGELRKLDAHRQFFVFPVSIVFVSFVHLFSLYHHRHHRQPRRIIREWTRKIGSAPVNFFAFLCTGQLISGITSNLFIPSILSARSCLVQEDT